MKMKKSKCVVKRVRFPEWKQNTFSSCATFDAFILGIWNSNDLGNARVRLEPLFILTTTTITTTILGMS